MAGYTRGFSKITDDVIQATDFNNEYQALEDAFHNTTGHTHDGSLGEGSYVPLISDGDNKNAIQIDSTGNDIEFYTEVATIKTLQMVLQDGALIPAVDNDIDLGSASLSYKDAWIDGTLTLATADINGGTIDGTVIGGTTPAAATVTTFTSTGIDDNCTTETLQIADDQLLLRSTGTFSILHADDTGSVTINGGNTTSSGGEIGLFGSTHATTAGDIQFRSNNVLVLNYDLSLDRWDFTDTPIVTTGALTCSTFTSVGIDDNCTGTRLVLTDTTASFGVNDDTRGIISIYGAGAASTNGGQLRFYTAADYDATYEYYVIQSQSDDLWIGSNADTNAGAIWAASSSNWDFQSNAITTTGSLTCGTFTSTGIDDNATTERLQVADTVTTLGGSATDYSLTMAQTNATFRISGGSTGALGGQIRLYGEAHGSRAGDIYFYEDTTTVGSVIGGNWNFQSGTITTTGALTCGTFTSTGIDDNATGERLQIGDSTTSFGTAGSPYTLEHIANDQNFVIEGGTSGTTAGRIALYGGTHASFAGDVYLQSGTNAFFGWDESAGSLTLSTGTGAKTTALTLDSSQNATFAGDLYIGGGVGVGWTTTDQLIIGDGADVNEGLLIRPSALGTGYITFGSTAITARIQSDITAQSLVFSTSGTSPALTLDSSQNATFAGDVFIESSSQTGEHLRVSSSSGASQATAGIGLAVSNTLTNPTALIEVEEFDTADFRGSLKFYTNGATSDAAPSLALTLDSSQNATFAGDVTINGSISGDLIMAASSDTWVHGHTSFVNTFSDPQTTTKRRYSNQIHGNVASNAGLAIASYSLTNAGYYAPSLVLAKSATATVGGAGLVAAGEELGNISFQGNDGTNFINAAEIQAVARGTPATNVMAGELRFYVNTGGDLANGLAATIDENLDFYSYGEIEYVGPVLQSTHSNMAIRQNAAGGGNLYFDVAKGGSTHGNFIWRSSSNNTERMRIDSSGRLNVGTTTALGAEAGSVTISTGDSGVTSVDVNADDLVVENNAPGGISILTPDINAGRLYFGSASDNVGAALTWEYGTAGATQLLKLSTGSASGQLVFQTGSFSEAARFTANGSFKQTTSTVAALPSASTEGAGARRFVTDANATTFASVVAGSGSNNVPVYSDGTNWRIG